MGDDNMTCGKILPISDDRDITLYPYYSLILPILQANPQLAAWQHDHFINVLIRNLDEGYYFDYTESCMEYYESFFTKSQISYDYLDAVPAILPVLYKALDLDSYVFLWVDQYEISVYADYQKRHFVHPLLLYGYSADRSHFKCLIFDVVKGVISADVPCGAIAEAFESGENFYAQGAENLEHGPVEILKCKQFLTDYTFKLDRFMRELGYFIHSDGDTASFFCQFHFEPNPQLFTFGLNVYSVVADAISEKKKFIDYRAVHMLMEHAKMLYKKLSYVVESYGIADMEKNLDDFWKLCIRWEGVAGYYRKHSLLESKFRTFYPMPQKPEAAAHLTESIHRLKNDMYDQLSAFYTLFDQLLVQKEIRSFKPEVGRLSAREVNEENQCIRLHWDTPVMADKIRITGAGSGGILTINDDPPLSISRESKSPYMEVGFKPVSIRQLLFSPDTLIKKIEENRYLPDVEVYGSSLCANKPVCASSNGAALFSACKPEYIYDDSPDTYWSSAEDKGTGEFLEIDLGQETLFNVLVVQQYRYLPRIQGYRLEVTRDGENWEEACRYEGTLGELPHVDRFEQVSAKKVRLVILQTITDRFGYSCANITRLEIYHWI